jgi:hypothetical protein
MEFSSTNAEDPFLSMDFAGPLDTPPEHTQVSVDNVEREDVVVRDEDFYYENAIFLVCTLSNYPALHTNPVTTGRRISFQGSADAFHPGV